MRPLLQEAQFACFEDGEGASSGTDASVLPNFVISSPAVRSQPPKSFARVRALECSGSGSFYFQNEALKDRFVCWRVLKNVVLLREWSLHTSLQENGVKLEFPAPVVTTGVFAVESWKDDAVTINVVTHAGTIHRFTYTVPTSGDNSIFSQADFKAFPEPKPATRSRCDVMQSLASDEILTVALWVNEYNLILGTDAGRVLGVNFGLPETAQMQEIEFSDQSVVSWLWHGLLKTTAAKLKGSGEDGETKDVGAAVIAMTCFQVDTEDEDDNGNTDDICVVTVSADCVLRAWSFNNQSCLGRQQLRSLVMPPSADDNSGDSNDAGWEDEDLDGDDSVSSIGVYATHAKVVALNATKSDNCRLLVHLDTTAAHSSEILLLRGDVLPSSTSSAGVGGEELALDVARVFTSFIHREVADVASDWKVESFVALARHCVRLGLNPDFVASTSVTGKTVSAELILTRSILRLSKLLGGDAAFQVNVFHDLVEHLFPFELWCGSGTYKPSSPLKSEIPTDDDEDVVNDKEDYVASRTIDEMCNQSLRVVLFLSYLVDTRPAFLSSSTLGKIVRVYLPKSITVYQRWQLSRWIANQGIAQLVAEVDPAISSSATLMPPLLQLFVLDVNKRLNRSNNFTRALSVLQLASVDNNPNEPLVRFLQKRKQFRLLRAMFCCNLSDISLHGSGKEEASDSQHSEQAHQYVRSIGECLACEGQEAAARSHDDEDAREHARWCYQQAIRCFSICLSNFFTERRHSQSEKDLKHFIYEVVGLLKETVPRGFFDQLLGFLWTVVTQALGHLTRHDGGEHSFALQSFIWVNVFKYSVEERLFRDAHLALMHTADLSAAMSGSDNAVDAENTASECVNYLVKELNRYGHLDLICELQWGALEPHVEKYILWQAANGAVVHGDGLDTGAIRYYNLLFAFYMRKQQPANAASSLYALALRLRLALSTSKAALEAQRNALNAACNALRALPAENRWVVRKLHTEELSQPSVSGSSRNASPPSLSVVTLEDIRRELAVLDGKLHLMALGRSESVLLSTMDGDEVVALLVDAVHSSSRNAGSTTLAERRRTDIFAIELAADIAGRISTASLLGLTKSLARYCVAIEHPAASSISRADSDLLWELLNMLLDNAASLELYEVAAETVLDFWQQHGRKLALPKWLYERLARRSSGNPALLLRLYLKHGLLFEALQLVEDILPDAVSQKRDATVLATVKSLLVQLQIDEYVHWMDAQDERLCPPGTHRTVNRAANAETTMSSSVTSITTGNNSFNNPPAAARRKR
ncbi:hypothetical protein BBJ29_003162 [Phytophthora kernoviae]|uniref:Nuclear pore complex protein NUP160 domain-containing protein n=1 Tax=Phytophthora kernoviae TaxID=325452 RepID=A0A3F2RRP5_9STRA|nr:hypothetical protein BBJ29_003162 [Phytophthora kernoviae]RLN61915.1 hypothetical protein BBP00_00005103 [Phytophthora kernoviae]